MREVIECMHSPTSHYAKSRVGMGVLCDDGHTVA